ncbi:MAG: hypothetical protein AB1899_07765 [Pseudomonadota bacterium]
MLRVIPALFVSLILDAAAPVRADDCRAALDRFDYPAARHIAESRLHQDPGLAAAWICLARSQYETGRFRAALDSLERTRGLAMTGPDQTLAHNWFGVTLRRLDRRPEAWRHIEAALAGARGAGDRGGLATALHNQAGLLNDGGRAEGALAAYRESLGINPDLAEQSASLNNMGLIELERGNPGLAERHIQAAIDLNRRHGHLHHLGKHLMNLGNLRRVQGRHAEAEGLLAEGSALVTKADDRFWMGVGLQLTAWLARDRGHGETARRLLDQAAREYEAAGSPLEAGAARAELAGLAPG